MAKEKKVTIDVDATTPEEAIKVLTERGYDGAAIYSFACAARSWCVKDDSMWVMWKAVEGLTSSVPVKPT